MIMAVVPIPNAAYFVDSRKRPLEEASDLIEIKRERSEMEDTPIENEVNFLSPPPGQLLLKVLIPGYAAGAVIGKGGQIIVQLQKDSGAIIKLSKAKDFYPGTQDRVVLIQGTAEGLIKVHSTIVEKVYDFPVPKDLAAIIGDRAKQVKIIVPNTTAGLVIGKAGATVKTIMDESGAKIQLSQKPEGINVQERVITIKGEKHQLVTASNIIIDKIKDDPQSASCPNISYSGIAGPVANANPTGSPYAIATPTIVETAHPAVQAMLGHYVIPGQHPVLQAVVPSSNYIAHHPAAIPTLTGPTELSVNGGLGGLANYAYGVNYGSLSVMPGMHSNLHSNIANSVGIIPTGSLATGTVNPLQSGAPLIPAAALPIENGSALPSSVPAGVQNAQALSLPNSYLASLASAGYQLVGTPGVPTAGANVSQSPSSSVAATSLSVAPAPSPPIISAALPTAPSVGLLSVEKSLDGQKETIDLAIPENLIGAILGKAGRTLVEFQDMSGAKVQISKKGEYVIGTRNRRVTITGKPPSTQTAHLLITQRINAAQAARAQQAKLM